MANKLTQGVIANTDMSRMAAGLTRGPNLTKKIPASPWSNTWPAPGATLDLDFANDRGFVRGLGQGSSMDAVTFTRASNATYVDQNGVLQTAGNNVRRLDWASTVQLPQNLLTSSNNFSLGTTTYTITANNATAPDGTLTASTITGNGANSYNSRNFSAAITTYTTSLYVRRVSGTGAFQLVLPNSNYQTVTVTGSWTRVSVTGVSNANGYCYFGCRIAVSGDVFEVCWGQVELGSSASTYQEVGSISPINTPLQATPTCNGLLIEESRANALLWCRDATQANWVSTNITPAQDQTGIDGVANSASSLTATSTNGTCIQQLTVASASKTCSVYLKRITGTGTVQVTADGSAWSTVDLSNGLWNRIVLSGTITNPAVGIKIVTSGDAVAMDFGQIEPGLSATNPNLTTTATVTRSQDIDSLVQTVINRFYSQQNGTWVAFFKANQISQSPVIIGNTSNVGNVLLTAAGLGSHNNGSTALNTANAATVGTSNKIAVSGDSGKRAVCLNGGAVVKSGTPLTNPVNINNLYIGSNNSTFLNGTINRIMYFPKGLPDDVLVNLTGSNT